MPTIKTIDKVKIDIYSREHPPPHIHAKFAEHEELIVIETLETYAGRLPRLKRKKVAEWIAKNKILLISFFKQLNPRL